VGVADAERPADRTVGFSPTSIDPRPASRATQLAHAMSRPSWWVVARWPGVPTPRPGPASVRLPATRSTGDRATDRLPWQGSLVTGVTLAVGLTGRHARSGEGMTRPACEPSGSTMPSLERSRRGIWNPWPGGAATAAAAGARPQRDGDPLKQPLDHPHQPRRTRHMIQQQQSAVWMQHRSHLGDGMRSSAMATATGCTPPYRRRHQPAQVPAGHGRTLHDRCADTRGAAFRTTQPSGSSPPCSTGPGGGPRCFREPNRWMSRGED
jgi:hypothetical protein